MHQIYSDLEKKQVPKLSAKNELAKDLIDMLDIVGLSKTGQEALMLQLLPYIIRRDHIIFNHAYHVGRESA